MILELLKLMISKKEENNPPKDAVPLEDAVKALQDVDQKYRTVITGYLRVNLILAKKLADMAKLVQSQSGGKLQVCNVCGGIGLLVNTQNSAPVIDFCLACDGLGIMPEKNNTTSH